MMLAQLVTLHSTAYDKICTLKSKGDLGTKESGRQCNYACKVWMKSFSRIKQYMCWINEKQIFEEWWCIQAKSKTLYILEEDFKHI